MTRRQIVVLGLVVGLLPALYFGFAPIAQIPGYHDLADQRSIFGIPHFWNIVSNVPFALIGLAGLVLMFRKNEEARAAWAAVFAASVLVALGSSWYHSDPNDATLIWDRVPIGIAFMGFLTALLVEHLEGMARQLWQRLLWPLVLFSAYTVGWWSMTGDLSLWVWVQLAPMLAVVLVLALLPGRYTHRRYLAYALACYAAAKLLEFADAPLMQWTGGLVSGHVAKHLLAAAGVWCFYVMLRERSPVQSAFRTGSTA